MSQNVSELLNRQLTTADLNIYQNVDKFIMKQVCFFVDLQSK